ncbi:hypothetical protein GCM10008908_19450 [Clostridium subterminale]|uniref:Uncharacterized protein n=1 Tax=Clostridium subterminale TaxID=1550 RepID=A0ABP3VZY2_CLOSU
MSVDLFKRTNAKDSEFKGICADTEKYSYNHSFKANMIATGVIVLLILGFIYLLIR